MATDIQFLERVKYFLFLKDTWRLTFSGPGNYINKFWSFTNSVTIETPEDITLDVALVKCRFGLVSNDTANTTFEIARKKGYFRRHIPTNLFGSIDDLDNIPLENLEKGVFCYKNPIDNYKKYVFAFKEYYDKNPDYNGQNRLELEVKESLHIKGPNAGWFKYALTIIIKDGYEQVFEDFLSLEYGDDSTGWRGFFVTAFNEALNGNIDALVKYDNSVLKQELSISELLQLLDVFDTIELPTDMVLSFFTIKDKLKAQEIIRHLNNDTNNLLQRLHNYFRDEGSAFNDELLYDYYNKLAVLFQRTVEFFDIMDVAGREKQVYENHSTTNKLYNKLAEEADVFFFNTELGIMNGQSEWTFLQSANIFNPSINTEGKLTFNYRCYFELNNYIPYRPDVNFEDENPFDVVKLYFIKGKSQLSLVDDYDKVLKMYLVDGQEDSEISYTYVPRVYLIGLILVQSDAVFAQASNIAMIQGGVASLLRFPLISVTGALSAATVVSFTGSVLFSDPEVSNYLNTNHPNFISNWNTIQQGIIILDIVHAGLHGIRNVNNLIQDFSLYRSKVNELKASYNVMPKRFRDKLKLARNGGIKYMDIVLNEWETYINFVTLENAFLPGKSVQWVFNYKQTNGVFPDIDLYINPVYKQNYFARFQTEGGAFLFQKIDIDNLAYPNFNPNKFVMLTSDMRGVVNRYKINGNVGELEYGLGYGAGDLKISAAKGEIYIYQIDNPILGMPTGNVGGVNDFWLPAGRTSGGRWEGQLNNQVLPHNNSIDFLIQTGNVKPILDW